MSSAPPITGIIMSVKTASIGRPVRSMTSIASWPLLAHAVS